MHTNWDEADIEAVYRILEEEVMPLYYMTSKDGIPHEWVKVMKETTKRDAPMFCTRRMVRDYIDKF